MTRSTPPSRFFTLLIATSFVAAACSASATPAPTSTDQPAQTSAPTATSTATPDATPEPSAVPTATPTAAATAVPVAWRSLDPAGATPRAREDHTWTVDPATRIAYVFGGRDGSRTLGDLWAFDLATDTWTRLDPAGRTPAARFGHEAVWVDGIGLVVYAGQADATTFFDDLWAYDPGDGTWGRLPGAGARPVARYGTCAALGPDGRLWISHGFTEDGTRFADTRAYDFVAERWSNETPSGSRPVNRCLHGCWWTDDGRLALYGGQTTGVTALGDLWSLGGPGTSGATWIRTEGPLPADRNLYAFARHGDEIVVFGGRGSDAYLDDVFALDATTLAVQSIDPVGDGPRGRSGATLIDDPTGGRVVLFGGRTGGGALDDLWELALP